MIWIGSKNIQTNVVILAVIAGIQLNSGEVVAETDPQQHFLNQLADQIVFV